MGLKALSNAISQLRVSLVLACLRLSSNVSQLLRRHVVLFLFFQVQVTDKVDNIAQLSSIGLFCSPPGKWTRVGNLCLHWKIQTWATKQLNKLPRFGKFRSHFPFFMVDPLSTTRTKFATLKGRGAHVEDEAIMVVSMPAVHPLHVGGGLLVVHRVGWVGWKQTLSAYLSKKLCSVKCILT